MRKKIGIIFIVLILGVVVFNLLSQILGSFKAGDRLTEAASRLKKAEIKNQELKIKLKEVSSSEFVEQQARDKLGLAREGETVIVIPENKLQAVLGAAKNSLEEQKLPNPLGWWKLFFR